MSWQGPAPAPPPANASVEQAISNLVHADPELAHAEALLRSAPGIGPRDWPSHRRRADRPVARTRPHQRQGHRRARWTCVLLRRQRRLAWQSLGSRRPIAFARGPLYACLELVEGAAVSPIRRPFQNLLPQADASSNQATHLDGVGMQGRWPLPAGGTFDLGYTDSLSVLPARPAPARLRPIARRSATSAGRALPATNSPRGRPARPGCSRRAAATSRRAC